MSSRHLKRRSGSVDVLRLRIHAELALQGEKSGSAEVLDALVNRSAKASADTLAAASTNTTASLTSRLGLVLALARVATGATAAAIGSGMTPHSLRSFGLPIGLGYEALTLAIYSGACECE